MCASVYKIMYEVGLQVPGWSPVACPFRVSREAL